MLRCIYLHDQKLWCWRQRLTRSLTIIPATLALLCPCLTVLHSLKPFDSLSIDFFLLCLSIQWGSISHIHIAQGICWCCYHHSITSCVVVYTTCVILQAWHSTRSLAGLCMSTSLFGPWASIQGKDISTHDKTTLCSTMFNNNTVASCPHPDVCRPHQMLLELFSGLQTSGGPVMCARTVLITSRRDKRTWDDLDDLFCARVLHFWILTD